jgi:hypothetical protein
MAMRIKSGIGALRNLMKNSGYWIKETNMVFKNLDDIIKSANTLVLKYGTEAGNHRLAISHPVMVTLENPLLRFSCMPEMKGFLAKSVAESIYALSGMNGGDFIWEFRGLKDSIPADYFDPESIGQPLRFWGEKTEKVLNYAGSNHLRLNRSGFTDQFQKAFPHLISSDRGFVISLREPNRAGGEVHSAWARKDSSGRLQMMVSCGEINVNEGLIIKIIPAFGLIQQMLSEVTNIPLGSLTVAVASLYYTSDETARVKELSKAEVPAVDGIDCFAYPASNLTLRDVDNLISMMQEFVGRLEEKSLSRANPYDGDRRVLFWSDMAECFRENKADELGYKAERDPLFYHPQLRRVYK